MSSFVLHLMLFFLLVSSKTIVTADDGAPTSILDPTMTSNEAHSLNVTTSSDYLISTQSTSTPLPSSTPPDLTSIKKCPINIDNVIGYVWPRTAQSSVANRSCPSPLTGQVKRYCTRNANWLKPSFKNCQATSIVGLYETLNRILSNLNESSEDALHFIQMLKNLTSQTFAAGADSGPNGPGGRPQTPSLTSDDLRTVNFVCRSTLPLIGTDHNTVADMFALFNNALDLRNTGSWRELQERDLGSEELLSTAEMYAGLTAKGLLSRAGEVIQISRQNIAIKAMRVPLNEESSDPVFPLPGDLANTTVPDDSFQCKMRLPSKYLKSVARNTDAVSTAFMLFPTIQNFLPDYVLPENVTVASVIVSAQVVGGEGVGDESLSNPLSTDPVDMNFTVQVPFDDGQTTVTCVYWNFTEGTTENSTSSGSWSSDGIVTEVIDNNTVRCLSSHLTSFAVLVDVSGTIDPGDTTPSLYIYGNELIYNISYIGTGLSVICLGLTIIFLLSLGKEMFEKVHYFVHLNLSIALLIGLILFMSGLDRAAPYPILCRAVAASLHFFFLGAFFWMLCEAIVIFLMIVVVFTTLHKKWYILIIIGWGIPLIIVGVTFSAFYDIYVEENTLCWLNDANGIAWSFSGPMLLIVLINLFIMVAVFVQIYRSKKRLRRMSVKGGGTLKSHDKTEKPCHDTKKTIISMVRGVIVLLPLLGVTWIGGLFSLNEKTFIVACVFSMINSFQGVFIFVFHVLLSQKGIELFKKLASKYHKKSLSRSESPNTSLVRCKTGESTASIPAE